MSSTDWEKRPARRQVKPKRGEVKTVSEEGGEYNIWYNRYQGEMKRWDVLEKAEYRCNMARDSGKTMSRPGAYFCIHFSRGKCSRGAECMFLHRPPDARDSFPLTYDCFGREKHRAERDDKSGVGSFEKDNRCLYVGPCFVDDKSQETVERHFKEWGELESVRFVPEKSVAFVRYVHRACAEFAKEAMKGQSLDNAETLDVRWAIDDPAASEENKKRYQDAIAKAVQKSLPVVGEQGTWLDYENGTSQGGSANAEISEANNKDYQKYYEDCANYYREMGDHSSAAAYSEYSLHYAKLAEKDEKTGDASPENIEQEVPIQEEENAVESSPSRKRRKVENPGAAKGAMASLSGYASDSD